MAVQHLEAALNYEATAAPALAQLSVADLGFDLALQPVGMALSASLGNLRAQDASLAEVQRASCRANLQCGHSAPQVEND